MEDGPTLRITLILDDAITRFERKVDGSVQFVGVKGDQVASVSAASFTELCSQHPEEVEKHLFVELKRAGFVAPEVGPPND